jgi:FKBP-type peptidyl-prolyl cis-trans isomerase FkpA/FKBP-type peptidyl-prolyl cis-trans isomerase FklB
MYHAPRITAARWVLRARRIIELKEWGMSQFVSRGLWSALSLVLGSMVMAADAPPATTPASAAPASPAPKSGSAPTAAHAAAAKSAAPDAEQDKTLYALGVLLSRNLETFQLSESEFAHVRAGLTDGFHKKADTAAAEASMSQIQALQRARAAALAQREREQGQAYLDKAASAAGATKTASGLLYVPVVVGSGPTPARSDRVKVNYEGRLTDGTVFDSSAQHGQAATLSVGGIIPCWTEALQLMKVGGKSRIVCPATLAYGDRGAPPKILPGATLEFDIELLSIEPPAPPPTGGLPGIPGSSGGPGAGAPQAAPGGAPPAPTASPSPTTPPPTSSKGQ